MIDLHLHTNHSDGNNSVIELLQELENKKINIISITDHDTTNAYKELESIDIKKYYTGKIIKGIEITASFKGNRIEILGYNFDNHEKVSNEIYKLNDIDWNPILIKMRKELLQKFDNLNLVYDESFKEEINMLELPRYEKKLYISLEENNQNLKDVLKEDFCNQDESFFRKCIANPKNKFYCNYYQYRPSIETVINLIHQNNGLCFYAHPFGYDLEKPIEFCQELINYCIEQNTPLDGIETYYYDFNKEEVKQLELLAQNYNLLKSGGSDCHDLEKDSHKLGKYLIGEESINENKFEGWINK